MSTEVSELKRLLSSPFRPEVEGLTLRAGVTTDGVLHEPELQYCTRYGRQTGHVRRGAFVEAERPPVPEHVKRDVALSEFVDAELCTSCKYHFLGWRSGWYQLTPVASALAHQRGTTRLASMLKISSSTTASAIQKRQRDIPGLVREAEEWIGAKGVPVAVKEALEELVRDLAAAEDSLRAAATGDDARLKVERKLKAVMLPKRFAGQDVALDASPLMIGISPVPHRPNHQVAAALEAYAIRKDKVAVLVAPAFVYAFLLQQLFPKSSSSTLVVSTVAPEDPLVRETAAGLWDPEGEGALACMQATIDAARALA